MTLKLGRHEFADDARLVMAIVDAAPDPSHDQGETWEADRVAERVTAAVDGGADIVDLGGVWAGPGDDLDTDAERSRLADLVARVRTEHPDVVVSVDTWRSELADAACAAGADLVNDSGGGVDTALVDVVADHGVALVCAHTGGVAPRTRPFRIEYADVVASAVEDTVAYAERAVAAGVDRRSVLIDPAHDLGKNTLHSLDLTRRLEELVATGWPVLVSVSNKDFVGETLDAPIGERLAGSLAATCWSVGAGARVFRAHEVVPTRHAIDMTLTLAGDRLPARAIRGLQ